MKTAFVLAAGLGALFAQPVLAQDSSADFARDGVRLEARLTLETPTVSSVVENNDVYKLGSAIAYGGEAGFDLAVSNNIVVGPYVNYEISSVENCDGTDCISAQDNLAAGLHFGYALNPSGQLYGKLGYASLALEGNIGNVAIADSGDGFQFAAGYEHALNQNLYARVEFGYGDNGRIFGINFQRRHASIALGARF